MSYIIKMALDTRARFRPPAPMTSPLEAYCVIGTIARAMELELPERKDTLLEMRNQLDANMGNSKPEDSRIARIHVVLKGFIRNEDTTDQIAEHVVYGYEDER